MASKIRQKRKKAIADDETGANKKKSREEDAFDVTKFKSMLKNVDTIFLALEEFGDTANGYPEFIDYDIVKDFITSSPDCSQIFNLIDGKTLKSAEVTKIFRVLECILIRTSDDLAEKYSQVGENIVSHLCSVNSKQIYLSLNIHNKPNQLKTSIKLLTAMVLQGDNSALATLDLFDDKNQGSLIPLYNHKNISDSQDVRTCVIHFMLAFLLSGSNTLIRQVLKKTELIQNIFYGISHDKLDLIEIILQIFQEKILENPGVNKSMKVGIFNGKILHELSQLYYWCGPQKWRDSKSSKKGEIQDTASDEDKLFVMDLVDKFLQVLCCSYKYGVAFFDKTIGTGKTNHNITLFKMLSSLEHPYNHIRLKQLVIQVLKECPDLLQHYLPLLKVSLSPRHSIEWFKCINFLLEIYDKQTTSPNLQHLEDVNISDLITMATTYFVPPDSVMKVMASGIKNDSILVRHKTIELYRSILNRGVILMKNAALHPDKIPVDVREYQNGIKDVIIKLIPTVNMVMNCWNKTIAPPSLKKGAQKESAVLSHAVSPVEHLILLEQFLCLNQQLDPDLIHNHPVILPTLLDGVSKVMGGEDVTVSHNAKDTKDEKICGDDENMETDDKENKMAASVADTEKMDVDDVDEEKKSVLQLYLLKIISDSDARLLPWKRKGKDKKSLMLQLLSVLSGPKTLAKTTTQLICKMLRGTGTFEGENGELQVWLKHVTNSNHQTEDVVILSRILNRYLGNMELFQDKLSDILSSDLPGREDLGRETTEMDRVLKAILALDDKDFNLNGETDVDKSVELDNLTYIDFPFTPLLLVAMEMIRKKEENHDEIRRFILPVIPDIYHLQTDTEALRRLLHHYTDLLKGEKVVKYVKSWKPLKQNSCNSNPVSVMLMSLPGNHSTVEEIQDDVLKGMVAMEIDNLVHLSRQILLYTTDAIQPFSQNKEGTTEKLQFYFQLLVKIVEDIKSKMSASETQDSEQSELFGDFCEREDQIKVVLEHILKHKDLQNLFLFPTKESSDSSESEGISQLVTPPLLKILESSASCLDTKVLEILKYSYTDKIFVKLKTSLKLSNKDLIILCLKSLIPFLNEDYHLGFIDVVLSASETFIVNRKKREMTQAGCLVIELLSKMLQKEKTLFHKLSLEQTTKIFNCLKLTDDKNLVCFCSELLKENPYFSLACSEDLWLHLLENQTDKLSTVMVNFYEHNIVCRNAFKDWITKSGDISKNKWCLKVRNSEEIVSLVYEEAARLPKYSDVETETDIEIVQKLAQCEKYNKKDMMKMWKNISEEILESDSIDTHKLELLKTLCNKLVSMDTHYREKLVILSMRILLMKSINEDNKLSLLDIISQNLKACNNEDLQPELREVWPQFVKTCLKSMYLEPKLINILIDCIPLVYCKSHDQKLPIKFLYEMVMNHSKFLTVMFGEKTQEIKESIISLLLCIAERSHDCYDAAHVRIFLGVYGATLSLSDQKLLKLISLYEANSVNLSQYQPFLFGQKALDFYSSKKYQTPAILRETKMADLIECLDVERLLKSALKFPLYRGLVPGEVKEVKVLKGEEGCYDPCFLLTVFNQLLEPGVIIDLKQFINTNCLGFVFAGLSSYVTSVRQASYLILKKFYLLLEKATFPEAEELIYLFDLLSRSIETPGMKLCTVITVFLSKMAKLFLSPENNMYKNLTTFLMSKPTLDFDRVPGFYRFFNSPELDHHTERLWILNLMVDGLRTNEDYKVYETLFCFKILQSYYQCDVSDQQNQALILRILTSACLDVETVITLYEENGILGWLLSIIVDLKPGSSNICLLTEILHNLWFTVHSDLPSNSSLVNLPTEFLYQIIQCVKLLLNKLGSEDSSSFHKIITLLNSTLKYFVLMSEKKNSLLSEFDNLLIKDIAMVFLCLGKFNNDPLMYHQAEKILNSVGMETKLLLPSVSASKKRPQKSEKKEMDDLESRIANLKVKYEEKIAEARKEQEKNKKSDLDLKDKIRNVKVKRTENVAEVIEIFLTWCPGIGFDSDESTSAAAFLKVVTYFMDNLEKVKDTNLNLKILDWIGSVLFQKKEKNEGFVVYADDNFSEVCLSLLTSDDDVIKSVIDKLLCLYSHGNSSLDFQEQTDSNSAKTDLKSESSKNIISESSNDIECDLDTDNDDLVKLKKSNLFGKLNKILLNVMKYTLDKSDDKKFKVWKKNLKNLEKDKDQIISIFIQEYYLGVEHPQLFTKLDTRLSLQTGEVSMDTSDASIKDTPSKKSPKSKPKKLNMK